GGETRVFDRIETSAEVDNRPVLNYVVELYLSSTCMADGQIYVGTRGHGVYAFDIKTKAARRVDHRAKLPSPSVDALAGLDGKVFAVLDGGYLVAFGSDSDTCDVLASSRRKDKQSPFDDAGEPFKVRLMFADPDRHRILFIPAHIKSSSTMGHGIWEYNP